MSFITWTREGDDLDLTYLIRYRATPNEDYGGRRFVDIEWTDVVLQAARAWCGKVSTTFVPSDDFSQAAVDLFHAEAAANRDEINQLVSEDIEREHEMAWELWAEAKGNWP